MSKIVFNKRDAVKSSNIMVRLESDMDSALRAIAAEEDVALTEVVRAFLRAGLDQYNKEGADVEL